MNDIKQQYNGRFLPEHDPRVQQVKKVLDRLLPYVKGSGLEDVQWEVNVIDSPEQNAFVIPG
jgi:predicted Zn-dependent protease